MSDSGTEGMGTEGMGTDSAGVTGIERRTLRRLTVRLVPLLMALYFVNYLDRTNLGIAKAEVSSDLALSATMFGLASGIFFIGYVLVEVPSNLALERFGARRWLARIAVSWGIVVVAIGFAPNAATLLTLRFLLGVAEAGLFPGVIFYLTRWFPGAYRARIVAMFMAAGYEKETQDGFERSVNVAGNPGWEKWDKTGKRGELNAVVGKRFLVQVEGRGVDDIKTLHAVFEQIDLKKLASLK